MILLFLQLSLSFFISLTFYLWLPQDRIYALWLQGRVGSDFAVAQYFNSISQRLYDMLPPSWQQFGEQKFKNLTDQNFLPEQLSWAKPATWLALKLLSAFFSWFFSFLFLPFFPTLAFTYIGFSLPDLWFKQKCSARKKELEAALPDFLDVMVICLQAGLNFEKGLKIYCLKFKNALSEEFMKLLEQMATGKSQQAALEELADCLSLDSISLLAAAVGQAKKLGTPLTDALKQISALVRENQKRAVKELVAKAPVKMLFPTAILILPALLLVVIGPMLLKMFASEGWF